MLQNIIKSLLISVGLRIIFQILFNKFKRRCISQFNLSQIIRPYSSLSLGVERTKVTLSLSFHEEAPFASTNSPLFLSKQIVYHSNSLFSPSCQYSLYETLGIYEPVSHTIISLDHPSASHCPASMYQLSFCKTILSYQLWYLPKRALSFSDNAPFFIWSWSTCPLSNARSRSLTLSISFLSLSSFITSSWVDLFSSYSVSLN